MASQKVMPLVSLYFAIFFPGYMSTSVRVDLIYSLEIHPFVNFIYLFLDFD